MLLPGTKRREAESKSRTSEAAHMGLIGLWIFEGNKSTVRQRCSASTGPGSTVTKSTVG